MNADDRAEVEAINRTLRVSSYLDDVYEAIHTGAAPKVNVPNLSEPTKGEILGKAHSGEAVVPSEGESVVPMDWNGVYGAVDSDQMKQAASSVSTHTAESSQSSPKFSISRNQWNAIQKYPSLVEFLGRDEGDKIAQSMHSQMNTVLAELISGNSQEANEYALICQAENQNLKQYFKGDNWICRVVASGPFRGDEAIYYSKDRNIAKVLRKYASDNGINYEDVSNNFNVIFEFGESEDVGDDAVKALEKISNEKGTESVEADSSSDVEPVDG